MIAAWVSRSLKNAISRNWGSTRAICGMISASRRTAKTHSRAFERYFSKPNAANALTDTPKSTVRSAIFSELKK